MTMMTMGKNMNLLQEKSEREFEYFVFYLHSAVDRMVRFTKPQLWKWVSLYYSFSVDFIVLLLLAVHLSALNCFLFFLFELSFLFKIFFNRYF